MIAALITISALAHPLGEVKAPAGSPMTVGVEVRYTFYRPATIAVREDGSWSCDSPGAECIAEVRRLPARDENTAIADARQDDTRSVRGTSKQ